MAGDSRLHVLCFGYRVARSVDGSQFGGFYGCVLQVLGEANLLLDIEPTTGKGKELPTTRTLLERAVE